MTERYDIQHTAEEPQELIRLCTECERQDCSDSGCQEYRELKNELKRADREETGGSKKKTYAVFGVKKTMKDCAAELGRSEPTIYGRLKTMGSMEAVYISYGFGPDGNAGAQEQAQLPAGDVRSVHIAAYSPLPVLELAPAAEPGDKTKRELMHFNRAIRALGDLSDALFDAEDAGALQADVERLTNKLTDARYRRFERMINWEDVAR